MIFNHLRVFDSDLYKIIPAFELKNIEGQYHSMLVVQLAMLQLACPFPLPVSYTHLHRAFRLHMAFPQNLVLLPHIIILTRSYL